MLCVASMMIIFQTAGCRSNLDWQQWHECCNEVMHHN